MSRAPSRILLAALIAASCVAAILAVRTGLADEPTVVKEGDTHKLKVGDKVVAESKQEIRDAKVATVGKSDVQIATWNAVSPAADAPPVAYYAVRMGADRGWSRPKSTTYRIRLQSRTFNPTEAGPALDVDTPAILRGAKPNKLFFVQFKTQPLEEYRKGIRDLGGEVRGYVPELTHLVRMDPGLVEKVQKLDYVRAVVPVLPTDKLERPIVGSLRLAFDPARDPKARTTGTVRYVLLPTGKEDRGKLVEELGKLGAVVADKVSAASLVTAAMTAEQVAKAAALDTVQWIERAKKPEKDMDKARVVGGADFLNTLPKGYTGVGIRGHVLEGIWRDHPDFGAKMTRGLPVVIDDGTPDSHGQCTYGQVFGDGKTKPTARGLLPDAQGYYTNNDAIFNAPTGSHGARFALVKKLIDDHKVLFQTASWGQPRTTEYTAYSADLDELVFELDMTITQSQSNAGNRDSRPQAWAKNVISVGGAFHFENTSDPDDRWDFGASIGPAADGRIKPDLCSFYDQILTTDGATGHTETFGGTSGATPIVAGHVGLCIEMWTNGIFPCVALAQKPTPEYRFENRPRASTVKALLIASATQFQFPPATDLDRFRQGWGHPNLKTLHDLREKSFIVNHGDVLANLGSKTYEVKVAKGEPMLRVTMVYPDPPANPMVAGDHRVNNLDLKVTDPDGVTYWGNHGLIAGTESQPGGAPNTKDTVENVFLANPKVGTWKVEVIADELVQDGHRATPEIDAVYSLVVLGATR